MSSYKKFREALKEVSNDVKGKAEREFKNAKENVEAIVEKAGHEWNKLTSEQGPTVHVSGIKTDCQKNADVYLQISQLKGQCEKSQVEVLIASLDKIGVTAPELVLFSNDLNNPEYTLSVRDCAWFDGQVEQYSNKLVECAKGEIVHNEL